ncbi:uncharacterized protein [Salminus brasiliensis]|uniref:uncharacterized protein n=1 Tax=Salminus brasiliensis TaxID=930266 RepID=UPI003B837712
MTADNIATAALALELLAYCRKCAGLTEHHYHRSLTSIATAEKTKEVSPRPLSSDEQKDWRPAVESPEEDRPSKKEPVGSAGRNVFARILKVAQRYLADAAKQNTATKVKAASPAKSSPAVTRQSKKRTSVSFTQAQRRRSQSRRSQNEAMGLARKEPLPPQCTDEAAAEESSQVPLRRLKSGPVGRVARRRSGVQSGRGRSLLLRGSAKSQKASVPASTVCPDPNQACVEPRESPSRNLSSEHPPLAESSVLSPSTGNEVRESQLI